jgi:hypothetical protein
MISQYHTCHPLLEQKAFPFHFSNHCHCLFPIDASTSIDNKAILQIFNHISDINMLGLLSKDFRCHLLHGSQLFVYCNVIQHVTGYKLHHEHVNWSKRAFLFQVGKHQIHYPRQNWQNHFQRPPWRAYKLPLSSALHPHSRRSYQMTPYSTTASRRSTQQ